MKNRKTLPIILAVLLLLTAALAVVHLATRESVPEGAILIRQNGRERAVDPAAFFRETVTGVLVNGKGEERSIEARGAALGSLADSAFRTAVVTADDEYSANLDASEADSAFLILHNDGSVQLVVFGDADSKRAVRGVRIVEFK